MKLEKKFKILRDQFRQFRANTVEDIDELDKKIDEIDDVVCSMMDDIDHLLSKLDRIIPTGSNPTIEEVFDPDSIPNSFGETIGRNWNIISCPICKTKLRKQMEPVNELNW